MRIIRLVFFSFLSLFLLITGISLFVPSRVRISRAVNIKADRNIVLSQLNDASNWRNWYPGVEHASLIYSGGHANGIMFDSSDRDHPVNLVITAADSSSVTARFNPRKLKPVTTVWQTLQIGQTDSITVQWYMDFHLRWYPWEKFSSLMLEKSQGTKMEEGLNTLRSYLHSKQ